MKQSLRVYPDKSSLDRAAAGLIVELLARARARRSGPVALALSGGITPRGVYELLASEEFSDLVRWPETEIYWSDERCLPPDHQDSNFRMARRALLSKVPVAEANVHRIMGELGPESAAFAYETALRRLGRGCDVVLLGAGEDGHTASLFPGTPALEERKAWAAANPTPKGPRVTMTLPYLNLSGDILILASGAAKKAVVAASARDSGELYPVQRLRPQRPALWLVDREAASGL